MKHIHTFESFLNEFQNLVTFSIDDDKLDQLLHNFHKRELDYLDVKGDDYYTLPQKEFDRFIDAADSKGFDVDYENSEDSVVYVMESRVNESSNTDVESFLNEATLKNNSYQSVLFGKLKSGKWSIIKSTDPKGKIQTTEDLYPRGRNDKYTEYCIIQDLGANRGQSLQQDAESQLAKLNSGEINYNTAQESFGKIVFYKVKNT